METKTLYLIEILRYGDPTQFQTFTITDSPNKIEEEMIKYNQYRGGKYPSYYVTEIQMNEFDLQPKRRILYEIRRGDDGKYYAERGEVPLGYTKLR